MWSCHAPHTTRTIQPDCGYIHMVLPMPTLLTITHATHRLHHEHTTAEPCSRLPVEVRTASCGYLHNGSQDASPAQHGATGPSLLSSQMRTHSSPDGLTHCWAGSTIGACSSTTHGHRGSPTQGPAGPTHPTQSNLRASHVTRALCSSNVLYGLLVRCGGPQRQLPEGRAGQRAALQHIRIPTSSKQHAGCQTIPTGGVLSSANLSKCPACAVTFHAMPAVRGPHQHSHSAYHSTVTGTVPFLRFQPHTIAPLWYIRWVHQVQAMCLLWYSTAAAQPFSLPWQLCGSNTPATTSHTASPAQPAAS
jgi:hypothetical protein